MTQFIANNNAASSLAAPISNTATSLTVQSGQGALFPNPSAGQQFALTMVDAATGLLTEVMYCTARSGDTMTVTRGQESTTALAWLAGDLCANDWTAGQFAAMQQAALLFPARIVTASGAFTMSGADAAGGVGLNRTSGLGASSTTLPNVAGLYAIEDLAGNFNTYPVTVTAPGGTTILGTSAVALATDYQCAYFRLYTGGNIWSFKP
jgi:hypothetical protein